MSDAPYRVRIVVDPAFGERLGRLPPGEPVWIVDSAVNTPAVHRLRAARPAASHLSGVTNFRADADQPAALLLGILDQVDLHHGAYSTSTPYAEAEVYGVALSPSIEQAFRALGFERFQATREGFLAFR